MRATNRAPVGGHHVSPQSAPSAPLNLLHLSHQTTRRKINRLRAIALTASLCTAVLLLNALASGSGEFLGTSRNDVSAGSTASPAADPQSTPQPRASATPTITSPLPRNFPINSTVESNLPTVVLRAIPRTIGEHTARLPGPRPLTVAGPVEESGDGLWLPVFDPETGVFGYLSIDDVQPEESPTLHQDLIGRTLTTTGQVRLRASPETATAADPPLPAGTAIQITGETVTFGLLWLEVIDPTTDQVRWVLPDTLAIEPTDGATPIPTSD